MSEQASFDLLQKRLATGATSLRQKTEKLNQARLALFGRIEASQLARLSARTEHNTLTRDLVRAGDYLLLGFNVFMGLKRELQLGDMFALYKLGAEQDSELTAVPLQGSFLSEPRFVADFKELMTYYRQTTLDQLRVVNQKLLLIFRTGSGAADKRVFRFALAPDGSLSYIDNRGDRDNVLPPTHDFEWQLTTREMHVGGRHPHVNILDTIFVETINGDLTIKVENNTETGLGIFSEPVSDKTQALADAEIFFADLKHQIVLKIKPYRESDFRYLLYNKRLKSVVRIDEIGLSAAQLPEDHGLVFPGGYALESGENKRFADIGVDFSDYRLKRTLRAPNGEDVLFVFYAEQRGAYALLPYNLIDRSVGHLLLGEGYARFADGRILLVVLENGEPSRIHPLQLWRTPFADADQAVQSKPTGTQNLLSKTGNATLVRALADLRQLGQIADNTKTIADFERLLKLAQKCADAYPWLVDSEVENVRADILTLSKTGQAALEAFAAIESQKQTAKQSVERAGKAVRELLSRIAGFLWQKPDDFSEAIRQLKRKRGEVMSLADLPYVESSELQPIEQLLKDEQLRVGERALKFFADPSAFQGLHTAIHAAQAELAKAKTTLEIKPIETRVDELAEALDGLTELISSFEQADPLARANLLASTSQLYADVNKVRAMLKTQKAALTTVELSAEFQAQLTVFEQAQLSALARINASAAVDDAQSRLLNQLNELEGKFAHQPDFAHALSTRREALLEALASRREQLRAEMEQRVQALKANIVRVFEGLPKRVAKLSDSAALHGFFASDPLVERASSQIEQLRALDQRVLADELRGQLKSLKESLQRDLRDRVELGIDGQSLRLGKHRFTVGQRQIELALTHDAEVSYLLISGTDYRKRVELPAAAALTSIGSQTLVSESAAVYRAETLAYQCLTKPFAQPGANPAEILAGVTQFAAQRPAEDYQRGIHDHDAALILGALLPKIALAGSLIFPTPARVLAMAWVHLSLANRLDELCAMCAAQLLVPISARNNRTLPERELGELTKLAAELGIEASYVASAAGFLQQVLGSTRIFPAQGDALDVANQLEAQMPKETLANLQHAKSALGERLNVMLQLAKLHTTEESIAFEAAAVLLMAPNHQRVNAELQLTVEGLLASHPRIKDAKLSLNIAEFQHRLELFVTRDMPQFREFAASKHAFLEQARQRLRLNQFEPKPMAGFVRNRLIDEVYLPLIGNNLAKQIGTLDDKRADRSGLLLLISPPGYGKTTLMEYLADRLGMIFVRINGPTLGHDVTSLDPEQCSHKGAREELEKLNIGLLMGNNVMVYLDDIQHLSPEFLQKFISLSDATRRVDAIDEGQAISLDLRGKRFAIVMAGNPYTESGDVFRIPDMLANRADVYNLGDVLSGREALFNESYIENALTANPLTAQLTELGREAVQNAVRVAEGFDALLPVEITQAHDVVEVLKRMLSVRDILAKINAAYVQSAAQDDLYRTEPAFKLQGSYRNMAKLTAQLSPLMMPEELRELIADHYRGEAQTLGARAEENLLKLGQLSGALDAEQTLRWQTLCENFQRVQRQGGKGADGSEKIANLLADIAQQLQKQHEAPQWQQAASTLASLQTDIASFTEHSKALASQKPSATEAVPDRLHTAFERLVKSYEETLVPLVSAMHHKMTLDHSIWEHVRTVRTDLDTLVQRDARKPTAPAKLPRNQKNEGF